jgi:hypothetical protein
MDSCASPQPSLCLGCPLGQWVCAGCCQPLLGGGPSRRFSAHLSLRAWTPTPAARGVHLPVSSSTTSAFPALGPGRRSAISVQRLLYGTFFRGCSHSLMFRPADLLTTQVAPTATDTSVWQLWFLRPSLSWFVTSPRLGYACRPNRAIDGRGLSPHKMRSLVGCSPNVRVQPAESKR